MLNPKDGNTFVMLKLLSKELSNEYAIHPTLITTFGLKYNEYSNDFIKVITIDDLFC